MRVAFFAFSFFSLFCGAAVLFKLSFLFWNSSFQFLRRLTLVDESEKEFCCGICLNYFRQKEILYLYHYERLDLNNQMQTFALTDGFHLWCTLANVPLDLRILRTIACPYDQTAGLELSLSQFEISTYFLQRAIFLIEFASRWSSQSFISMYESFKLALTVSVEQSLMFLFAAAFTVYFQEALAAVLLNLSFIANFFQQLTLLIPTIYEPAFLLLIIKLVVKDRQKLSQNIKQVFTLFEARELCQQVFLRSAQLQNIGIGFYTNTAIQITQNELSIILAVVREFSGLDLALWNLFCVQCLQLIPGAEFLGFFDANQRFNADIKEIANAPGLSIVELIAIKLYFSMQRLSYRFFESFEQFCEVYGIDVSCVYNPVTHSVRITAAEQSFLLLIIMALPLIKNLAFIYFENVYLSMICVRTLAYSLKHLHSRFVLSFAACEMSDLSMAFLLYHMPHYTTKGLMLKAMPIACKAAHAFIYFFKHTKALRIFHINDVEFLAGALDSMAKAIVYATSLYSLYVSFYSQECIQAVHFMENLRFLTHLKEVTLADFYCARTLIAALIALTNAVKLRILRIVNVLVKVSIMTFVARILQKTQFLLELQLNGATIDAAGATALAESFGSVTRLKSLTLQQAGIDDAVMSIIAAGVLAVQSLRLEVLNVAQNSITFSGTYFWLLLQRLAVSLVSFVASFNAVASLAVVGLAAALRQCTLLRELQMNSCSINQFGGMLLMGLIPLLPRITFMELVGNAFSVLTLEFLNVRLVSFYLRVTLKISFIVLPVWLLAQLLAKINLVFVA